LNWRQALGIAGLLGRRHHFILADVADVADEAGLSLGLIADNPLPAADGAAWLATGGAFFAHRNNFSPAVLSRSFFFEPQVTI